MPYLARLGEKIALRSGEMNKGTGLPPMQRLSVQDVDVDVRRRILDLVYDGMPLKQICTELFSVCAAVHGSGMCLTEDELWKKACDEFGIEGDDAPLAAFRELCDDLLLLTRWDRWFYFVYVEQTLPRTNGLSQQRRSHRWAERLGLKDKDWEEERKTGDLSRWGDAFNLQDQISKFGGNSRIRTGAEHALMGAVDRGAVRVVESLWTVGALRDDLLLDFDTPRKAYKIRDHYKLVTRPDEKCQFARPITVAASRGDVRMLELLLRVPYLSTAAFRGDVKIVDESTGLSRMERDVYVKSALVAAVEGRLCKDGQPNVAAVKVLLDHPNVAVDPGIYLNRNVLSMVPSPFLTAVALNAKASVDVVKLFLSHPRVDAEALNRIARWTPIGSEKKVEDASFLNFTQSIERPMTAVQVLCSFHEKIAFRLQKLLLLLRDDRISVRSELLAQQRMQAFGYPRGTSFLAYRTETMLQTLLQARPEITRVGETTDTETRAAIYATWKKMVEIALASAFVKLYINVSNSEAGTPLALFVEGMRERVHKPNTVFHDLQTQYFSGNFDDASLNPERVKKLKALETYKELLRQDDEILQQLMQAGALAYDPAMIRDIA